MMAVEKVDGLLANLTAAERNEVERRAQQIRELKKKVGTQRALQLVGSGLAIAGGRPELISQLKPKFGYTPDEIAARKAALRKERLGLMGEKEAAVQFGQTLLKDLEKNKLGHKASVAAEIQRMFTGGMGQLAQSARKQAEIEAGAADALFKEARAYSTMDSTGDEVGQVRVSQALQKLDAALPERGSIVEKDTEQLSQDFVLQLQKVLTDQALRVPGSKEQFLKQIGIRNFKDTETTDGKTTAADNFKDKLKELEREQLLPRGKAAKAILQAWETDIATKDTWAKKREELLDKGTEKLIKAGRKAYGGTWNQDFFNKIESAMLGVNAANTDEEASEIMRELGENLAGESPINTERQNEIENLRRMEEAYDKDLGTEPVKKAYRIMEASKPVQKLKAQLKEQGYQLTDKQVVKLILKNSRQEMIRTGKISQGDNNLLVKMIREGVNIVDKSKLPSKEEAKLLRKASRDPKREEKATENLKEAQEGGDMGAPWGAIPGHETETSPLGQLKARAGNLVDEGLVSKGATITQGANPLDQTKENAEALKKVTDKNNEDDTDALPGD